MQKVKVFVDTMAKKQKTASEIYKNSIEISKVRKNQFRALRSLKLRKMVSFGNSAMIASL